METFTVRVTKDYLTFCSAHFIVFGGSQCERLHGHNYRIAAELEGELDEDRLVFDFIALKGILREIANELDHRFLVPLESRKLGVDVGDTRVRVTYDDKEWIVPIGDCALLPIENSTAELLAKHISRRLLEELAKVDHAPITRLAIEVEESHGQSAFYRREFPVS